MRRTALALIALVSAGPADARRIQLPVRPNPTTLLAGPPILPNGLLIRDGEQLRTLELDDLAPLRFRFSFKF